MTDMKSNYKHLEPELDICVIAHNNIEKTIQCIKALYANTVTPFHLIVVDDSLDQTPEWIENWKQSHTNITHVVPALPYKSSYPAIKDALEVCKTPYMALVVNSVTVEPDWEVAGLQTIRSLPKVAVVGLKCIYEKGGLIESAGLVATKDAAMLADIGRGQPSHRYSKVYECVVVQWALVIIRKSAITTQLDTQLYNGWKGWEEFETCYQLRDEGWRIMFCGLGVGYHQPLYTRGCDNPEHIRLNLENREIFAKRWGFWKYYHEYAPYVGEFFPDMPIGHKELIDPRLSRKIKLEETDACTRNKEVVV